MNRVIAFASVLATIVVAAPAVAEQCPGNPGALGTSRTLVVDPSEHHLLGGFQYRESLPLADKEVVLTFDDGPLPPYSTRILDILASECVKATYFMVGKMAKTFPKVVKRTFAEGHTLASHSQTHPYSFHRMTIAEAVHEIHESFYTIRNALGNPDGVAPFFRFPGLLRQDSVEAYLKSQKIMAWSVDFMGDDWTRISSKEIVRRALMRLEAKGKGILLLHDIQPATALGLPELLRELKVRGYRIVHVVPATADRPKTVTTAAQWIVRHPPTHTNTQQAQGMWPRIGPVRLAGPPPALSAPSLTNFGAATDRAGIPVALVPAQEMLRSEDRDIPVEPLWPADVSMADLAGTDALPIPAADTFRYTAPRTRQARRPGATEANASERKSGGKKKAAKTTSTKSKNAETSNTKPTKSKKSKQAKSKDTKSKDAGTTDASKGTPKRPVGHQIQVSKPTASLPAASQAQ